MLATRLVYHTNSERTVSFYGGVALQAGISTYAKTGSYTYADIFTYTSPSSDPGMQYYYMGTERREIIGEREETKQKTNLHYGASIPVGVSFRLAKQVPILSHLTLDLEFMAGFMTTKVPGLKTYIAPNYNGQLRLNYRFGTKA